MIPTAGVKQSAKVLGPLVFIMLLHYRFQNAFDFRLLTVPDYKFNHLSVLASNRCGFYRFYFSFLLSIQEEGLDSVDEEDDDSSLPPGSPPKVPSIGSLGQPSG